VPEMIDILAAAGADVQEQDNRGRTPLDVCEHKIDEIPRLDWIDKEARKERVALFKQVAKRLRRHIAHRDGGGPRGVYVVGVLVLIILPAVCFFRSKSRRRR